MTKNAYETVVPETLNDINLLDAKLQNCPYPAYEKLREEAPVWKDPLTGFYVITRFDDVRDLLLDTARFANASQAGRAVAARS